MYIKRLALYVTSFVVIALVIPHLAFAINPKVDIATPSYSLSEGSVFDDQISLQEPIICEDPDVPCLVQFNLTSSDPSRVTVSPSTISIPADEWSEPQTVEIDSVFSDTYNNGETVTISSSPVVSASEYYSGFQPGNISVTLPQASAPVLTNSTFNVISNGIGVPVNVMNNASNYPDSSTISILTGPSHGVAEDPSGYITYTADLNYVGSDELTYQICSSIENSVCSTATIKYEVTAPITTTLTKSLPITPDTGFGSPTTTNISLYIAGFTGFLCFMYGFMFLIKAHSKYY